jgi:hypothetical protein
VEAVLENNRILLKRKINQYSSVLKIPPESSSEIFRVCLEGNGEAEENDRERNETRSEGSESYGCTDHSNDTPSIRERLHWQCMERTCVVDATVTELSVQANLACIDLLEEWLFRSGRCLLNFSLGAKSPIALTRILCLQSSVLFQASSSVGTR